MPDTDKTSDDSVEQPSLFFPDAATPVAGPKQEPVVVVPTLTPMSVLGACALPYQEYLRRTDHSVYTITCFLSDLRLLTDFLGRETPLRTITQDSLAGWLGHLRWDRATQPAPKTMARRATFLKNFFGWLAKEQVLADDPSQRIVLTRPAPPLPELLFEDEVARLEQAAEADPRCQLLVMTLLATGLKKEELMAVALRHVDLSDPEEPALEVHFPGQAKRRRERRMTLPAEWTDVYQRYVERYQPRERLFECTDRNLNYVLAAAVKRADLDKRVTLQLLRDIFAVRQLRAGASMDELREKLGLSEEAWYEIAEKYRKLAFPA
ncbi:MAG TPA: tyrosine-type recombinase/integrase [Ktedonobacterales bacterium]|nr:tyrosine-type recombinase/integrase [Ktedonobacterales bacterium]